MDLSRRSGDYQVEDSLANDKMMVTKFSSKVDVDVERATISNGLRRDRGSVISFHDVHYKVTVKEGCCSSCKSGEDKHIIKGIRCVKPLLANGIYLMVICDHIPVV